jgi:fucose permease
MASSLLASNLSWKVSYMILAGIAVLNCVTMWLGFRGVNIEEHEEDISDNQAGDGSNQDAKPVERRGRFSQSIRLKFTWIAAIFLLFYVGVETTIGSWGYTFLTTARNGDAIQMARVSCSLKDRLFEFYISISLFHIV